MLSRSQSVKVIGVDTDTLEEDETFKEAYAFYIKLSEEPDAVWRGYLSKWENTLKTLKRKIEVVGDRLRLVFVFGDDVENYAKYAEQLVNWVNDRVFEYNDKMDSKEKAKLAVKEEQQRKKEDMRLRLRQLHSEPESNELELTVEELASAYEANEEIARSRFEGRILKVKGLVNRIGVRDDFDTQYVVLGYKGNPAQIVRCTFDKIHIERIKALTRGQEITIQGKFTGSRVQLSMRQCILVS